ncbi:endolysin [Pseudomonas phage vB_PpuM-Peetri]
MLLTELQFKKIFPSAPLAYLKPLQAAMDKYLISLNKQRMAMFLGQIDHESGDLAKFEEGLNYSADGLANTWPTRYGKVDANGKRVKITNDKGQVRVAPNDLAIKLARKPQAIANNCYANRMGNGDEASGDGWKYRGRCPIMRTGKAEYLKLQNKLGIPLINNPDLLALPEAGFMAAADYWDENNCNKLADAGRFFDVTQAINGGQIGADDRKRLWDIAAAALTA